MHVTWIKGICVLLSPWQNISYLLCSSGLVTKSLWFIFSQISNSIFFPCRSVMLCWWIRSLKNAFILTYWTYCTLIQLCRHADHFDSSQLLQELSDHCIWVVMPLAALHIKYRWACHRQLLVFVTTSSMKYWSYVKIHRPKKGRGSSAGAASAVFVITVDKYVMENCGKDSNYGKSYGEIDGREKWRHSEIVPILIFDISEIKTQQNSKAFVFNSIDRIGHIPVHNLISCFLIEPRISFVHGLSWKVLVQVFHEIFRCSKAWGKCLLRSHVFNNSAIHTVIHILLVPRAFNTCPIGSQVSHSHTCHI